MSTLVAAPLLPPVDPLSLLPQSKDRGCSSQAGGSGGGGAGKPYARLGGEALRGDSISPPRPWWLELSVLFSHFPGGETEEGQVGEGQHFGKLRLLPPLHFRAQLCQAGNVPGALCEEPSPRAFEAGSGRRAGERL